MKRRTKVLLLAIGIVLLCWVPPKLYTKTSTKTSPKQYRNPTASAPKRRPPQPKWPVQRPAHVYRNDGLLEVNPNATHPIFELTQAAQEEWTSKLRRASQTLDEAVEEYLRRYNRFPPKGFDEWWEYVVENNVSLPDEYDTIFHRLEPFWGVHPRDLQQTLADWEVDQAKTTVTIGKERNGPIQVLRNVSEWENRRELQGRISNFVDVLKAFEHTLPNFRAVFLPGDNPNLVKEYELMNMAIEAAAGRTYIDMKKLPPRRQGWLAACKPSSPARQNPPVFRAAATTSNIAPQPKVKTFIHNHQLAMDPCLHPSHLVQVGQYLSHNEGPLTQRIIPQFSMCATPMHLDILPVPPTGMEEARYPRPWREKTDQRLYWRGRNTGMRFRKETHWQMSQRVRLVRTATELSGTIKVLRPPREDEKETSVGEGKEWTRSRLNPAIMDVKFVRPIMGATDEETHKVLEEMFDWGKHAHKEDSEAYKYIMDVDGNAWSNRFRRLLSGNSVVFKSTTYPEWFADRIQPWVHYVPISIDYSDLYDAFVFFRGDPSGEGNHDELARKIAAAGQSWTQSFWRKEDITAYMFRRRRFVLLAISITLLFRYGYWILPNPNTTSSRRQPGHASSTLNNPSPPKEPVQRAAHVFRSDGLLEVNPNGTHPIFALIEAAEAQWTSKLLHASRTFDEAVEEYERRYKRLPPKGFDDWWDYVVENDVSLPDEYDTIFHRLEPFWGVHPRDLQQIVADWEVDQAKNTVTIGKERNGSIHVLRNVPGWENRKDLKGRISNFVDMLKTFEHALPNFRAIFTPGDNPSLVKDYELTNMAIEAAAGRNYIDVKNLPPRHRGWLSACKPSSPAHKNPPTFRASATTSNIAPQPKVKTFIHNHQLAMDPCLHPSHLVQVGQYLSHNEGPTTQRIIPQFAMCATPMHLDILPVPPTSVEESRHPRQWEEKFDERLLWRGRNTGMQFRKETHWQTSQRVRLVRTATELSGTIKVLRPPREDEKNAIAGAGEEWKRARLNPAIMDVKFVTPILGASDETHKVLEGMFEWGKHMRTEDSETYKYVMDVDGNGWSSRFRRLLSSNSVVFKSTTYPEWFADRIQPWVHYVPISIDYSDLYDAFVFFRGDISGEGNHDELARKIAAAARSWTKSFWRKEDVTAYMFRLFLEYGRIMSLDRDAMTYND
ncbi:hypothetical protein BD410DRAFT_841288 [Rickenella mellea]|uniref:Glycosyl transferase CAP10 domain-containing protein n=1 Tax=Rickenella mellea TaxID=50990 RepID=A0A4Y7PYC3_9AGAM|nr:hypothetical protein BD410DRAFT_841288 [Rickenella mellea]